MNQPLDQGKSSNNLSQEASGWSFLPYEKEQEIPRHELQILRAVKFFVIPLTDIVTLALSVIIGYFTARSLVNNGRLDSVLGQTMGEITPQILWTGLGTIPLWVLIFYLYGVYKREIRRMSVSTFDELSQTVGALAVGAWIMYSFLIISNRGLPSGRALWVFVLLTWIPLMFMVPLGRSVIRIGLSFYNPFRTSTLVIGAGEVGQSLIGRLSRHKEYGLRVVGFLDTDLLEETNVGKVQLLGKPSELRKIIDQWGISRILIAFSRTSHPRILEIIHECQEMKIDVSVVPRYFEAFSSKAEIEDIEGLPMLSLPRYARHGFIMRSAKRSLDLIGAGVITFLLAPFLLIIAVLIKLDSPGPVFYCQERMGKNHKPFKMYKFRSMYVGADKERDDLYSKSEVSGPLFKIKKDPRITGIGRFMRRLSIDELPQLFNVLKGDMSLVGPRPLYVKEALACTGTADMRHLVLPGITGWWQILGRSDIPYEEMIQLDYLYVTNWTLKWDIKILLRTVIAIVRKRGAY